MSANLNQRLASGMRRLAARRTELMLKGKARAQLRPAEG